MMLILVKGTENHISSDPPYKDGNVCIKLYPLKVKIMF